MTTHYLACDLGAESGRLMLGTLSDGRLALEELHRFPNTPIKVEGSLCWDVPRLFDELKAGLKKAAARKLPFASISCDSWGVDYLLYRADGSLLSPTFHYRDVRTARGVENTYAKGDWPAIFAETGIQFMPLNTIFQLAAESPARLEQAQLILSVGCAFNHWLCGVARFEESMASTTQLYDPITRSWSDHLIEVLGLPRRMFPRIVPSGTRLGFLKEDLARETSLPTIEVIASCSHDTGAAVAAIPATGADWSEPERSEADSREDPVIQLYLRQLDQVPTLAPEEESELAARSRSDENARARLIEAYLAQVAKVARDYEGAGLSLLDLIQEGNLGLLKAVERFDPAKGGRFSTYASWWIRQAIRRAWVRESRIASFPLGEPRWAYLSSGTWSLMGVESATPVLTDACRELNFTNEIGYGGSVRLLKNISGLWLVQECRREWAKADQEFDYATLTKLAAEAPPFVSLINPADARFISPDDMPGRIAALCRETGQPVPATPGAFIRCALEGLALLYRRTLGQIEQLIGKKIERLHIVGGGSRNDLLNQFTANALQIPVLAGPVEATAAGNVLVQAIALGHLPSLAAARQVVRDSWPLTKFEPQDAPVWDEAYRRFEKVLSSV